MMYSGDRVHANMTRSHLGKHDVSKADLVRISILRDGWDNVNLIHLSTNPVKFSIASKSVS